MRKNETESFKKKRVIIGAMLFLMTIGLNINVQALESDDTIVDTPNVAEETVVDEYVEESAEETEDVEEVQVQSLELNENMLDFLGNTLTVNKTEYDAVSGWHETLEEIQEGIKSQLESQGYDSSTFSVLRDFVYIENSCYDIHKLNIDILDIENGEFIANKTLNVIYSQSTYNETDAEYVKDKIGPLWFHRYQFVDIDSQDKRTIEEVYNDYIDDSNIEIIIKAGGGSSIFTDYSEATIYFFKDKVLYGIKTGSFTIYTGVTIPDEIKENTQSYIDYALPKLKEKYGDIELEGKILSEIGEADAVKEVQYDKYYYINSDYSVTTLSGEDDDSIANIELTDAYFSQFFYVYMDGYNYGSIILKKQNVYVVNNSVLVNAKLDENATVTIEPIEEETLKEMTDYISANDLGEVISSHEVILNGDVEGDITLTFALGNVYNGKTAFILHKKQDGSYETFTEIVKEGKVTITVSELSPFVISVKDTERVLDDQPNTGIIAKEKSSIIIDLIVLLISTFSLYILKREV